MHKTACNRLASLPIRMSCVGWKQLEDFKQNLEDCILALAKKNARPAKPDARTRGSMLSG
jgi:hypothetical protein